MRTIEIDASKPLCVSFTIIASPVPWERSRLEFTAVTECSEGIRLSFADPEDVRTFAALVRRFAAHCRQLERIQHEIYSPFAYLPPNYPPGTRPSSAMP